MKHSSIVTSLILSIALFLTSVSGFAAPVMQQSHQYQAGEVLVKYRNGINAAQLNSMTQSNGVASVHQFQSKYKNDEIMRWAHVKLAPGMDVQQAIKQLSANPNIERVEPNYIITINLTPNDPSYSQLWGLHNIGQTGGTQDADIDAPEAWDINTGSGNVVVAVIDSGVDYTHPDLAANIWVNSGEIAGNGIDDDGNGFIDDINGYDFINNDADPMDDNSHGTHVSGTIAAVGNNALGVVGVSWNAKIMGLKFLGANGSGSTAGAIQAVLYAANNGANIINASWGGGGFSQSLSDAITTANNAGVLFVAAAGNANSNNDLSPFYPASYTAPNVISVASTTSTDGRSGFSNYGATTVDLGAPGSSIYSTTPGNTYGFKSGTSMASPHVAGAAAVVLAANPGFTVAQLKARLLNTVDVIPSLTGFTVTGGRLNLNAALGGGGGGPNQAPTAVAGGPYSGTVGNVITLNGSGSSDPEGSALSYSWTVSDGRTLTGATPSISFATAGSYTVSLVVSDGLLNSAPSVANITITAGANQAPTANPGGPYTGTVGNPVTFDGSGSTDPEGNPLTYSWEVQGSSSLLTGVTPSFTFNTAGTFNVWLRVNDGSLNSTWVSTTATITNAPPPNQAPTAVAGGPYSGLVGNVITLNGSGSSDPEGSPLTYSWTLSDGRTLTGVQPSVSFATAGTYSASLVVSDGSLSSTPSVASITVSNTPPPNQAPTAVAGGPYSGLVGSSILLNGTASSDPEGSPLTYSWTLSDGRTLTGAQPTVSFATAGSYTASLVVSDGTLSSTPSVASITVTSGVNQPPTANPGGPYSGTVGNPVTFNGSGSSDPDGNPLTYTWEIQGSVFTGVSPSFTYTSAGTYTVWLRVNDGLLNSSWVSTTVTITSGTVNQAPTAVVGGPYTGSAGVPLQLNGTGSFDPEGSPLTYQWEIPGVGLYSGATPTVSVPTSGSYNVWLRVNDGSLNSSWVNTTLLIQ